MRLKAPRYGKSGEWSLNLINLKQPSSSLLSGSSLHSVFASMRLTGLLLLSILLLLPSVQAQQVPLPVYTRYVSLTAAFTKMSEQDDKQVKAEVEANNSLINDIADFYQQQNKHSTERQLLASNLQLQVLLMQQDYQQSYQVVDKLLSLSLELEQQLRFQQLAAQLAAQSDANSSQKANSWKRVTQHLNAWFRLEEKLDDKQRLSYKITSKQQASNAALLAQAYYLQEQLTAALTPAKLAYKLESNNESYLQLLLALLQRLELNQQLNKYLQVAVVDFPKSTVYWPRLAYSYLNLDQHKPALSALAISRDQGLLTAQGYRVLASLYLQQQQPRLAADVYLEGVNNKLLQQDKVYFTGLTNAWLMARERSKALDVLGQAEAAGVKLTNHEQQQAQLLYLTARWPEAELAYAALLQEHNVERSARDSVKSIDEKALLKIDKWRFLLALSQIEQDKKAQAKDNLLLLQTKQYQGYAKGWLAQLQGHL